MIVLLSYSFRTLALLAARPVQKTLRTRRRKNPSQTKRTHLSPSVLPIGRSCLSPGVLPMAFMRHTPSHPHRQTDGPKHNGPSGTTHSIALPQAPIKLARQSAASHSQDVREGPIRDAVTLIHREASLLRRQLLGILQAGNEKTGVAATVGNS